MPTSDKLVQQLIKNNISLENKTVELIKSVNTLTKEVNDLVKTFKSAADYIKAGKGAEPLTIKLNELLEQNKNIARGLILLERYVRERSATSSFQPKPMEKF